METDGGINKHRNNSYEYREEYLFHTGNNQNDKPIDLTNGHLSHSSRNTYAQQYDPCVASTYLDNDNETSYEGNLYNAKKRQEDNMKYKAACRSSEMVVSNNPAYFNNVDNQGEVLKAAKSLFSKRTRTLYHWVYPNTPKFQLKSAISLAWDTMGLQEKQFYISQVLGKFGYLQNSLMVNPQLGCMSLTPMPLNVDQTDLSSNVETRNAVSNLLQEGSSNWPQLTTLSQTITRKRGRPRGSKGCASKSKKQSKHGKAHEEDDFTDDPELRRELEQFQWALHMVEK